MRCAIWKFSTFSNPSWELLIWNFQVRLEKEVLFETFETWNFSYPSWGGGCLFETFRWDLKWDVLFETFNLFKPIMRADYLKLSDETRNKICLFETFSHGSCLDLKKRCYLKCLKLETFQTCHGGFFIWNFQMRLEMRCAIWNFSTFSNPSQGVWNKIYFQTFSHGGCLFETFTWNEMCYLKLFKVFNPSQELVIWNFQMTWNEMCYLKLFKLFNPSQGLVIWNFQIRLEVRCVIWNFSTFSNPSWELLIWNFQVRLEKEVLFETFETWNFSNPSWGGCLFESFRWDLKWDVLFETFETWNFSNPCHESCFIWNFQMRLETRCAIWNCLKLETFQTHVMGVAYLKLSDDLKQDMLFEMFETWNFSNMSWGVAYLKLSDKTWNEMCYLKLFKLFNPSQELVIWNFQMTWNKICYLKWGLLIWNFQIRLEVRCAIWNFSNFSNPSWGVGYLKLSDDLKWDVLFETFQTFQPITGVEKLDKTWSEIVIWNFSTFSNPSWELLTWNLKKRCYVETFETWNFSNPSWGGCLFESFRWDLKKRCYLKCLKLETFQTCHGGFFIWNFQMRLEMRCAIWNFSTFSNPSQELLIWNFQMTWNKICYLKCLKLETFQTCHGGCLFETFRWDLKWDVLFETFQSFQPITGVGYLKLSDKTWKRGAIWNFWNFSERLFKTHHRSWLFETFR